MNLDTAALAEGLDRAIDELLAVRVALSDRPVALPDLALDEVLRASMEYQEGRKRFAQAIEAVLDAPWDALPQAALDVEAAANEMLGCALEVAWQLGVRPR